MKSAPCAAAITARRGVCGAWLLPRRATPLFLLLSLTCMSSAQAQLSGGTFTLQPTTLDAGGGRACDTAGCIAPLFELTGTIGQIDAGVMNSNANPRQGFWLYGGFWYAQNPSGATPVTLAEVRSARANSRVTIDFATSSEVGTVAFEALSDGARSSLLAAKGDGFAPRRYTLDMVSSSDRFFLRAHDLDGSAVLHGPFVVGQTHGRDPQLDRMPFDWAPVRAAVSQLPATRTQALRDAPAAQLLLAVDRDGVYELEHADLVALGIAQLDGTPIAELALMHAGTPQPIDIDSADGTFGAGDRLRFVGLSKDSLYTKTSVYVLERNAANARRFAPEAAQAAASGQTHLRSVEIVNPQRGYHFAAPGSDPFYAERVVATQGQPVTRELRFTLDGGASSTRPSEIAVHLWGGTDYPGSIPDHHIELSLNGRPIGAARFDGLVEQVIRAELPAGALVSGEQLLTIRLPADHLYTADVVLLDRIAFGYDKAMQARAGALTLRDPCISDSGADVLFASGFENSVQGNTTVACAPLRMAGFSGAVQAYALGATPRVITGNASGGAITWRNARASDQSLWLADATGLLHPQPRLAQTPIDLAREPADYLIITHPLFANTLAPLVSAKRAQGLRVRTVAVTDAYTAYSHHEIDPSAIQLLIRDMHQRHGTRYVALIGGATYDPLNHLGAGSVDLIPTLFGPTHPVVRFGAIDARYADVDGDGISDLALGRFPARSTIELSRQLDKLSQYAGAAYRGKALFIADKRAREGDFKLDSQTLGALLPSYNVTHSALDNQSVAAVRGELQDQSSTGVGLIHFLGHSSPSRWSFQNLLSASDVANGFLNNAGRPSVVLQWGCWNSYHVEPAFSGMAHALLLGDQGAASIIGAASLLDANRSVQLATALLPRLEAGETLGEALNNAQRQLAQRGIIDADVQQGVVLLGDPALKVR